MVNAGVHKMLAEMFDQLDWASPLHASEEHFVRSPNPAARGPERAAPFFLTCNHPRCPRSQARIHGPGFVRRPFR